MSKPICTNRSLPVSALSGSEQDIVIQLHEQLDYAEILYNQGLYLQSLKILDRIKEYARDIPSVFPFAGDLVF